jgi:hypothetical protein
MKKMHVMVLASAFGVLGFVTVRMGWSGVLLQVRAVGKALPILLGLSLLRLILQTMAWSTSLRAEGIEAGFAELVGARSSSRGVGYLSVLGPVVAEPLRISLLRDRSESAAAATLIDTGVYWFSSGVFGILGSLCALHLMAGNPHAAPLVALAALSIGGLVLIARPKPLLPAVVRALGRRCPQSLKKGIAIEAAIRDFQARHPGSIRWILILDLASQILIAAEVVTIFTCFRIPFHAGTVLALEAANRVVKMMGGLVPARIGTDESGMAAAFLAFGLPSACGLTLALARRTRDLLEAVLGIGWLSWRTKFAGRCPFRSAVSHA